MLASHLTDALSPEAYLALERAAIEKSEFVDGRIVAMSGASYRGAAGQAGRRARMSWRGSGAG